MVEIGSIAAAATDGVAGNVDFAYSSFQDIVVAEVDSAY